MYGNDLPKYRRYLVDMPAFKETVALHRKAADLVADIVVDEDSVEALRHAEQVSRQAVQACLPLLRALACPSTSLGSVETAGAQQSCCSVQLDAQKGTETVPVLSASRDISRRRHRDDQCDRTEFEQAGG
jgi:hypothetical protein